MLWLGLIAILVVLYLLLLLGIAWFSLHPVRIPIFLSPGGMGFPQEDVEFTSSDGTLLRGWWSSPPTPSAVAILSHGYLMNRSELAPLVQPFATRNMACLFYDFRAHGRSGGRKSYLGFREKEDVKAAATFARSRTPEAKLILMGSSMGAASSALAQGDDPALADALVLDCAYGRLSSAIIGWWRFLGGKALATALWPTTLISMPLAGFNPFEVDVSEALGRAGPVPVLFFHGEQDNLALPSEALRNAAACVGFNRIVWLPNSGHAEGRWLHPEIYNSELLAFLDEHVLNLDK
jgi:pimeloyl-ACP methyl ester carboxylesterase